MKPLKTHQEFLTLAMEEGWAPPPGYPPGIQEKILAGRLDEANRQGSRTRLLRFLPDTFSTEPFVHEYWEEVLLISGDLWVGTPGKDEPFAPFTYACRPPGVRHGPFRSVGGCLLVEFHYFP